MTTVEEFDGRLTQAIETWTQGFKAPTEAFKAELDKVMEDMKAEKLDPVFITMILIKSTQTLSDKLEEVISIALTPELMIIQEPK